MKKLSSVVMAMALVCGLCLGMGTTSEAAASDKAIVVDGSALTHESEASTIVYSQLKGYYLLSGSGTIGMPGNGKAAAAGTTLARTYVPAVSVNVSVQRYIGNGSWASVYSWSSTNYNNYSVETSKTINVTPDYYYRVYTNHVVETPSGDLEILRGSTNGIWIN